MKGYLTSFAGMRAAQADTDHSIDSIEIPLIQRDYAQGRSGPAVEEIRKNFVDALLDAVSGDAQLSLDFVYGKVDRGVFHPLDGQQRLTTLFLLHWYLASITAELSPHAPWATFSYATRPGARMFCQRLVSNPLPEGQHVASGWIKDQPWYLHVWRHDPTIQSMLVMVDAIQGAVKRRAGFNAASAWARLVSEDSPAISFYLLPLQDMDSDEELYIKMNSRGKPLTPFENFKAKFEQDIKHSARANEFAHKVDGAWSDLLWPIHGGDNIVDDEFMRYIDFLTEIAELREDRLGSGTINTRARAVFGGNSARGSEHLGFLFSAFDIWTDAETAEAVFDSVFSVAKPGEEGYRPDRVTLHTGSSTNLFEQCCHQFDSQKAGSRAFTLEQSMLLYAVILHLVHETDDFPRRVRSLRNLIAASQFETRRTNMPELLNDVEAVVLRGDLGSISKFNSNQVDDELLKQEFLAANPDLAAVLFRLEDHPLLQGTLTAFDLDPTSFVEHAEAFEATFADSTHWLALTGALLATGDYQRRRPGSTSWQFGTSSPANEAVWRYLLTTGSREQLTPTRAVLATFFDGLRNSPLGLTEYMDSLTNEWLVQREKAGVFDCRYHLVKYPAMRGERNDRREGATGIYFGLNGQLGYAMCMLRTKQLNGYYRDPILLQLWLSSGIGDRAEDPWFTGYETTPRWLRLVRSRIGIRSVSGGFAIEPPDDPERAALFRDVCASRDDIGEGKTYLLQIPQADRHGEDVDTVDRIDVGAQFLRELVDAGL